MFVFWSGLVFDDVFVWWGNGFCLDGFDIVDNCCVDQNLCYRVEFGIKQVDNVFVVGKQVGDVLCGQMVNGEQIVWYVDYFVQDVVVWYMYVMVVVRGEVSGYKCVVVEFICYQVVICQ